MDNGDTVMQLESNETSQKDNQLIVEYQGMKLEEVDKVVTSPWNTGEVGYFYPDNWNPKHVETKDHTVIFHNVYAFVSHLRALVGFKLENVMRANIQSCLREEALGWFITELNSSEREALRARSLEEGWFKQLLERFSLPPKRALFRCQRIDFSEINIFQKVHNLVQHFQAGGNHNTDEQAMHTWRFLESSRYYKGGIPRPEPGASLSKLLRDIYFVSYERGYTECGDNRFSDDDDDNDGYEDWCKRNPEI
ncbi:hypothetical protein N7540_010191 [Penicillium herquei]|nr:hypothetical protein N7540_010191 [Penicillium herquei]